MSLRAKFSPGLLLLSSLAWLPACGGEDAPESDGGTSSGDASSASTGDGGGSTGDDGGTSGEDSGSTGDGGPCDALSCDVGSSCVVTGDAASCECDDGYVERGSLCVREAWASCQDEDCSGHGTCDDADGTPTCVCDAGYAADGLNCESTDPCASVDCSSHGTCEVIDDAASCDCDDGYHVVGSECIVDSGPCSDVTCSGFGDCAVNGNGDAVCNCDEGYRRRGLDCAPDPCAGVTCGGHGTCGIERNRAKCTCEDGYTTVGDDCAPDSACEVADTLDCGERGPVVLCCVGDTSLYECSYVFADDKVLVGLSAALGYCDGSHNGNRDGYCSGAGTNCCTESGISNCVENSDPASCNAATNCYWTDPEPYLVDECDQLRQFCVEDRRFRVCPVPGGAPDQGYAVFEDGTTLYGRSAASGYCLGTNDGTVDGECVGPTSCLTIDNPTDCDAQALCTWQPEGP